VHTRCAAWEALAGLAKADNSLAKQLLPALATTAVRDRSINVRQIARKTLTDLVKTDASLTEKVLEIVLNAVGHLNHNVRRAGCEAIRDLVNVDNSLAERVVWVLMNAMKDEFYMVRMASCKALGELVKAGYDEAKQTPVLMHLFNAVREKDGVAQYYYHNSCRWSHDGADVREAACEALGEFGKPVSFLDKKVLGVLDVAAKDKVRLVRRAAYDSLAKLAKANGDLTKQVLPHLLIAAGDSDEETRKAAIKNLVELARADNSLAKQMLPHLLAAAKCRHVSTGKYIRQVACEALAEVAKVDKSLAEQVLPALLTAVKDRQGKVHVAACEGLAWLTKLDIGLAKQVIPSLLSAVKDVDLGVRKAARDVLDGFSTRELVVWHCSGCDGLMEHIVNRLCTQPLVLGPGEGGQLCNLTLHQNVGAPVCWEAPREPINRLKKSIQQKWTEQNCVTRAS